MQALALKYRPKNFDELIGQDTIAKSLSHALDSKRLSHAYLFSGLRGSGKTSSARIFAKDLICEKGPTSHACEECDNCIMANEGRHIDIIEMDAASHRKIDDIRELIEQTKYAPSVARYKIFIIDEVHMLTTEASNALLKTLEEPPEYVKFILATTNPLKLPATVLSRTQHFRFKPIATNLIMAHLEYILQNENIAYEQSAIEILARSGSGSLRDTLTLLDQAIIFSGENITQSKIAEMLGLLDPTKIDEILKIIINQDRNALIDIIKEIENYAPETIIDELISNLKSKFLKRDTSFSLLMYERFFRILAIAKGMLSISNDNGYTFAMAFFKMMEAVNLRQIDELIEASKNINQNTTKVQPQNAQNFTENQNLDGRNSKNPQSSTKTEQTLTNMPPYKLFVKNIYDRDYDLGEIFDNYIEFDSFENGVMTIISNATDIKTRNALNIGFKALKEILKQTFGEKATLKVIKKDNEVLKEQIKKNMSLNEDRNETNEAIEKLQQMKKTNKMTNEEILINELDRLFGAYKV